MNDEIKQSLIDRYGLHVCDRVYALAEYLNSHNLSIVNMNKDQIAKIIGVKLKPD